MSVTDSLTGFCFAREKHVKPLKSINTNCAFLTIYTQIIPSRLANICEYTGCPKWYLKLLIFHFNNRAFYFLGNYIRFSISHRIPCIVHFLLYIPWNFWIIWSNSQTYASVDKGSERYQNGTRSFVPLGRRNHIFIFQDFAAGDHCEMAKIELKNYLY